MGCDYREWYYCSIRGGAFSPDKMTADPCGMVRRPVSTKWTGFWPRQKNFGLVNDFAIREELLKRTNVLSYIPIKKTNA
jgi:hypothetical protein